eukprot:GHVR01052533.1.p1 GENE.GHVR01052533.1~~GHVR01052533.1.p1  ORF type:complete len:190 (+),score=27.51 GHVR01052533.1:135-704(+)
MCRNKKAFTKVAQAYWGFSDESAQHCFVATQAESVLAVTSDTNRYEINESYGYEGKLSCTDKICLEREMSNNVSDDCESCVQENIIHYSTQNVSKENMIKSCMILLLNWGVKADISDEETSKVDNQSFVDSSVNVFVGTKEDTLKGQLKVSEVGSRMISDIGVDIMIKPRNLIMKKKENIEVLTTAKIN